LGILPVARKYFLLGVKKEKIRLQSPKIELRPDNIINKFPHLKDKNK
jgi:hypothetical protein